LAHLVGIDTGGTYTDAVLWDEAAGVVAKAKALTTKHDLAVGIGEALAAVLQGRSPPRLPPTRWSRATATPSG
jgi:N-methylhydantoinase A/oxoprolinase/acetone carboxylase beta subunit